MLSKIGYTVPSDIMRKIAECSPGIIEVFLYGLLQKIESHLMKTRKGQVSFTLVQDNLYSKIDHVSLLDAKFVNILIDK